VSGAHRSERKIGKALVTLSCVAVAKVATRTVGARSWDGNNLRNAFLVGAFASQLLNLVRRARKQFRKLQQLRTTYRRPLGARRSI